MVCGRSQPGWASQAGRPGLTPWVATLRLTEGYKLDYQIVDRWKDLRGMPSDDLLEKNEAEYEKLFDEFE